MFMFPMSLYIFYVSLYEYFMLPIWVFIVLHDFYVWKVYLLVSIWVLPTVGIWNKNWLFEIFLDCAVQFPNNMMPRNLLVWYLSFYKLFTLFYHLILDSYSFFSFLLHTQSLFLCCITHVLYMVDGQKR